MSGGSVCIFKHCLEGLHVSCIKYGPPPNTVGGRRVVCACPCHTNGEDVNGLWPTADAPDWSEKDAVRMALGLVMQGGDDPRVKQIVEGRFE